MSLVALKREYEERRQALIEQLQRNQTLDPATQHQIYGAIKEIENFLKTIDYQMSLDQERNINVELERQKPNPILERTQKAVYHVAHGTKKIFTEHIPNVAKKAYDLPKNYFDKRREEARLRKEIEAEIKARRGQTASQPSQEGHVVLEHPHQDLDVKSVAIAAGEPPQAPAPTWEEGGHPHVIEAHEIRKEPMAPVQKTKTKPSKKAKQGHQHKPHMKRDKANRYHRK